jgi:uncharacterized phage protein (TIGR02220 family)
MAKWYQRHLGDYLSATRHLSLIEHGAYTLLLDYYYATEQPIPSDVSKIDRIFGLKKDSERAIFRKVLLEFFTNGEDGWRNKKADAELEKMHKISERRAKAGKVGAMTTNRNRSANAEQLTTEALAKAAADHSAIAEQMPEQQVGNCSANGSANGGVTIASASAITNKEEGKALSSEKPLDPTPPVDKTVDDGGNSTKARRAAARAIGTRVLEHLNARCGTRFATTGKAADAHMQHIVARIVDDGATEKDLIDVVNAKAFEWGKEEEMRKYLRPATLFARENFANYVGLLQVVAPKPPAVAGPKLVCVIRLDAEGKERRVYDFSVPGALTTESFPWEKCARDMYQQHRHHITKEGNRTLILTFEGERRVYKLEELERGTRGS